MFALFQHRRLPVRTFLAVSAVYGTAVAFPNASFCLFHEVLGVPCPLCGGTRAISAMLHLSFMESFRWNPGLWIGSLAFLGTLFLVRKTPEPLLAANRAGSITSLAVGLIRIMVCVALPTTHFIHLAF